METTGPRRQECEKKITTEDGVVRGLTRSCQRNLGGRKAGRGDGRTVEFHEGKKKREENWTAPVREMKGGGQSSG